LENLNTLPSIQGLNRGAENWLTTPWFERLVKKLGYTIYMVYEDIISGAAKERQALERLMEDARKRKFDIVLVCKFDRSALSQNACWLACALSGVGYRLYLLQGECRYTTSMGRLIFHINSAYAEFEREIIRDRAIAGIKAKRAKAGAWGRRALQDELQQKIHELSGKGLSIRKIAKTLQISARTVQKYIHRQQPEIRASIVWVLNVFYSSLLQNV
jgi:DNA invertase Pin-like site-specific DNA recombinase